MYHWTYSQRGESRLSMIPPQNVWIRALSGECGWGQVVGDWATGGPLLQAVPSNGQPITGLILSLVAVRPQQPVEVSLAQDKKCEKVGARSRLLLFTFIQHPSGGQYTIGITKCNTFTTKSCRFVAVSGVSSPGNRWTVPQVPCLGYTCPDQRFSPHQEIQHHPGPGN